jgi:glycosyltransferase involved in cell wall biosynthesis
MSGISVLILTRNEALNLPECLRSVAWSDDVYVLDSHSDDATVAIARAHGVHVVQRAFDGYASQRNAGLELPFKHDWILSLDADERIPSSLAMELQRFTSHASQHVAAARMRRRDIWWGRWLRHAQMSPFYIRLTRKGRARYEREVNEVLVVDGAIRDLEHHFDHFPFSKGVGHWIARHNSYSRMEADLIFRNLAPRPSLRVAMFGTDFNERRVHQKAIFYRLPGRPMIKLIYLMVVRGAFLDGWPGVRYAMLQAIYEYFIVLKTRELRDAATVETERSGQPLSSIDAPSLAQPRGTGKPP